MQPQSRIEKWFQWDDKEIMGGYQHLLDWLAEEELTMKTLVEEEQHWDAFKRLNLMFLYCSHQLEAEVMHSGVQRNMPYTMYALLDWISNNKKLLDEIVQGIGGDGYGIATSTNGMNISVSFSSGSNSNVISSVGVQSSHKVTAKGGGMDRALRQRVRAPSPNANRSSVKNPNNPAFRAAANNRSNQMNRNSPAYRSSRSGSKGRK